MTSWEFNEVIRAWNVSAERKIKAIGLLMNGINQKKVLHLVEEMSIAEGAVRKAQIELDRTNKVFDDFCTANVRQ